MKTNRDVLKTLIDETDGLEHVAIAEAIRYYTSLYPEDRPTEHGDTIISNIVWWDAIKSVESKLVKHFERPIYEKQDM
jgi:hypothetical protein